MTSDFEAQAVLAQLGRGRDAAVTIGTLQERMGWTRRQVERALRDLRLAGFEVASASSGRRGVWLADEQELETTILSLHSRLISQYLTLRRLRERRDRMRRARYHQETLWTEAA